MLDVARRLAVINVAVAVSLGVTTPAFAEGPEGPDPDGRSTARADTPAHPAMPGVMVSTPGPVAEGGTTTLTAHVWDADPADVQWQVATVHPDLWLTIGLGDRLELAATPELAGQPIRALAVGAGGFTASDPVVLQVMPTGLPDR